MLRVTEIFYSTQGEGLHCGAPSVFLRMFGCNFKCAGFGMPKGKLTDEWTKVDVAAAKNLKDLPIVKTGCDSYASWDPRCKHLAQDYNPEHLAALLLQQTPTYSFQTAYNTPIHLVITGGEPLLGWQKHYPSLFKKLNDYGLWRITFETNATQSITPLLSRFIKENSCFDVTFSCSPKLSHSGEKRSDAIKKEVVRQYQEHGTTVLKFVVMDEDDVREVMEVLDIYDLLSPKVYLMPVGGTAEEYQKNSKRVAQMCLEYGFCYSPRLHCDLYGNQWGT